MALPNPAEIQYFLEVAGTSNISRAAERLGITQPTLSLAVQRLEDTLGIPLLVRGKTGVKLTRAGARFAAQARTLVDQWEKLKAETVSEETEVKGRVTIGCHASVALYSVGGFAARLLKTHPELELAFSHDLSRKITERVISFELDMGIVVNPVSHPDLRLSPLCTDEVSLWRGPQTDFVKDVLICDPELIQTQAILTKIRKASGEWSFTRRIHSANLEVVAKLVASGAGVGILPARVAKREPSYRLKPFAARGPVFEDKVFLVYRPDAHKSAAARAVSRAIEAAFGK